MEKNFTLKHIVFEVYNGKVWSIIDGYCAAIDYDRNDAKMLKIWYSDGLYEYFNPVRNVQIETIG